MIEGSTAHNKVKAGSSRAFGFVFAGFFFLVAVSPVALRSEAPRLWAVALSTAFLSVTLLAPKLLQPMNIVWFRFGLALHAVLTPVVMTLIFVFTVVPAGLIVRLMGKDILRLKRSTADGSYWILRNPPGPDKGSMSRQF